MKVVRLRLAPDQIAPPNVRWDGDSDTVQVSPDGGTTWIDAPELDPRSAPAFAAPPDSVSDDPACDGAERIKEAIRRLIDICITVADYAGVASAILAELLRFLYGAGTLISLILEVVSGLLATGGTALDAAFTGDVYEQIKCYALAELGSNGHFDGAGYADFQSLVLGMGGTVAVAMGLIFQLEGINGFNNAASLGTEIGDCDACRNFHRLVIDFKITDGSEFGVTLPYSNGTWVSGTGWVANYDGGANFRDVTLLMDFGATIEVTNLLKGFTKTSGFGSNNVNKLRLLNPVTNYATTQVFLDQTNGFGTHVVHDNPGISIMARGLSYDLNDGNGSSNPTVIEQINIYYTGDIPDGWVDN